VHRASWPTAAALSAHAGQADPQILAIARDAIAAVRKAKSEAKVSMRTEVSTVTATGSVAELDRLALIAADLRGAGRINDLQQDPSDQEGLQLTVTI
jgi:valyl-tRNA synthetase